MNCACVYTSGDGDLPEFCSTEIVKARKAHRCVECRDVIAIGQRHERTSGKWDGEINSFRTCLLCVEIRAAFMCEGWTYGLLWEDVEEQMFKERGLDSACLEELSSPEAKQFLQRRWWAWVEAQQ